MAVNSGDRHMHLIASLMTPGHFRGAWTLPGRDPHAFYDIANFQRLAQVAERGGLDAVFIGDSPAINSSIERLPGLSLDPLIMLAAIAAVTERIGLIATSSTTYKDPYNLARSYQALDHVSGGRGGWNVVTTMVEEAAANFGLVGPPSHADRYARASEFLEIVERLWDSWEDDAVVADKESGLLVDMDRVHDVGFEGQVFRVIGPMTMPRSPQGRPVVVQAGASEAGRAFSARYAEVAFTVQQELDEAVAFAVEMRERARAAGRPDGSLLISPGVILVLGGTEREADERRAELEATIPLDDALEELAERLSVTPDMLELDTPVPLERLPAVEEVEGVARGFFETTVAMLSREPLTPRQLISGAAGGKGHRMLAGAPEQVADSLQTWFEAGAADGFTIMAGEGAVEIETFVDGVVPILRRRGLVREGYEGTTLREHLGLARPASLFAGDGAAA